MTFKIKLAEKLSTKVIGVTDANVVRTTEFVTIIDNRPAGSFFENWQEWRDTGGTSRKRKDYFDSAFFTNTTNDLLEGVITLFDRFRIQIIINLQALDAHGIVVSNLIELAAAHKDDHRLAQRLHSIWYHSHSDDDKAVGIVHDDIFARARRKTTAFCPINEETIAELEAREAADDISQFIRPLTPLKI